MIIYYLTALIFILGLSALNFFYFSLKWSIVHQSKTDIPKSKKIHLIVKVIIISSFAFGFYFIGLYLVRRFVFIGKDAKSIDNQIYFISLFISLIVLLLAVICFVAIYLESKGLIKQKPINGSLMLSVEKERKTKKILVQFLSILVAFSLTFSIMGNANYFKYDDNAIYYSSFFQFSETKKEYRDIEYVSITFKLDEGSYVYTYKLRLKNGKQFSFGLYADNLKDLNRNLVAGGVKCNFEAEHCRTKYNEIFGS